MGELKLHGLQNISLHVNLKNTFLVLEISSHYITEKLYYKMEGNKKNNIMVRGV